MDANSLRTEAYNASNNVSEMAASAPSMLSQLKQNLVGIFSKDNPVMQARDNALSTYLSTPSATRAEILTPNMPVVEGRNLTLSPTQQDAIVSGRSAAALAPLAGLNEILKAQYGTIGDMVQGAGGIYDAQVRAAQGNVGNLIDLYKTAVAEEEAKRKASESGGLDLASLIATIGGGLGVNAPTMSLDDIFGAAAPKPIAKPQPKVNLSGSVRAAGVPGATTLPQGGGGQWALSSLFNWLKGPQVDNNFKSLGDLGL